MLRIDRVALVVACVAGSVIAARATTISIVNSDGAGEGFNDPTAVSPAPGNPGTTLGAQRLNVFQAAAAVWEEALESDVLIQVSAQFNVLTCTPTSAVLGSAGPTTAHRDFSGAPLASTYYVQATANSRKGSDLSAANPDITAQFNSRLDDGDVNCIGGEVWWYGIDSPFQPGTIDLYTTVLHEIGHGLGFLSLHNLGTGAKFNGFDDAYLRLLHDESTNKDWSAMTNAQRLLSQKNTTNLTWLGSAADGKVSGFSAGSKSARLRLFAPNPVQSGSSVSHWDTALVPNELMEPVLTTTTRDYATYLAMGDIGWVVKLMFKDGFESGDLNFWSANAQ